MFLDIQNLSADQIQKVRSSIENYEPVKNKMGLMRLLMRESVQDFDVDSFYMSLSARN